KQFPIVRVMGTIGWIAGNWAMWGARVLTGEQSEVNAAQAALDKATESGTESAIASATAKLNEVMGSLQFADSSPHIFTAAAIASAILGVYCLSLPKTAPPSKGKKIKLGEIVGIDAWGLLKQKSFFVFAVASFLICIPLAGYYSKGAGYVGEMGITLFGSQTGAMSTGQMSEIIFMLIMPFCFARLGVKWMLAIGMGAWVARYGLWGYAFGQEGPLLTLPIFIGILLHGICYDFFFVTGMIYTDKKAPAAIRSQAQSLVVMLTQGLGLGVGAQLFGQWTAMCTTGEKIDFSKFWYAPAVFALVVMVLFILLFWDKSVDKKGGEAQD
ncbi:MAG: MFS transporter, partial [Akkermansiaceae bacterium]